MRMPVFLGVLVMSGLWGQTALCAGPSDQVVRIAQIVVDPAYLGAYQAAVKEEMADSVRLEPGVVSIYCVAEKDHPNHLHFFEVYASDAAYRSHIASPHFRKYVATTQDMILSRELIDTQPVQLSAKVP